MLNFFLTKKVVVKFILFYTFFTNYLSQKGFCAPSVTWSSLEAAFRGVPLRSLGELGARLVQEEGSMNWTLEVSIQLSSEEGDQVFDNLMPGRSESLDWERGSVENELYD